MENNTIIKRRPILAIIAGVLLLLHIGAFIFSLYCTAAGFLSTEMGLIVLAIVAILSLTFAIINFRSRIKVAFIITLLFNNLLITLDFFAVLYGLLSINTDNQRRQIQQELYEKAQHYASVEYVKEALCKDGLEWYFVNDGDMKLYHDSDSKLESQFMSMEFTTLDSLPDKNDEGYLFFLYEDGYSSLVVTFSKDDTMFVQATAYKNGQAFTPFAHEKRYTYKIYTFDHEEGVKFFNIADEIKAQNNLSI